MDAFPVPRIGPTQTSESTGRRAYRYFHSCLVRHRGRVPENRVACAMRPVVFRIGGRRVARMAAKCARHDRTNHTLYSWWIEFMGFEQLAELRAQLAAKAKQERNAKRPAAPADTGAKPKSGDQPQRGAAGCGRRQAAHARSRLRRSRRRRSIRSSLRSVNCSASFRVRSRRIRPQSAARSVSGTTSHVKHRPGSAKPNCVKRCRRGAVATVTGRASSKTPCGSICRVTKQGVSRMTMRLGRRLKARRPGNKGAGKRPRARRSSRRQSSRPRPPPSRNRQTWKRKPTQRRRSSSKRPETRIRTAPLHTARAVPQAHRLR